MSNGIERPVLTYRSRLESYFWLGVIGLQAEITVVLAFNLPTTEALAEEMVCCSMASSKEFSSFLDSKVSSSMQQTPLSANTNAPG